MNEKLYEAVEYYGKYSRRSGINTNTIIRSAAGMACAIVVVFVAALVLVKDWGNASITDKFFLLMM